LRPSAASSDRLVHESVCRPGGARGRGVFSRSRSRHIPLVRYRSFRAADRLPARPMLIPWRQPGVHAHLTSVALRSFGRDR